MDLTKLKLDYISLLKSYDEVKATNFIDNLVKSDSIDVISFHYNLLENSKNEYLFNEIRGDFYRHGEKGKIFLLDKLKTEKNISLKAEALFILGTFDDLEGHEIDLIKNEAVNFIKNNDDYKLQYYGIIVLGWIGNKDDLLRLEHELEDNTDSRLRDYVATALRQIWYNYPRLKKSILKIYYKAFLKETDNVVNSSIIACVQDMLQKKLGIREDMRGNVSGNLEIAKPKAIKVLEKFLKI